MHRRLAWAEIARADEEHAKHAKGLAKKERAATEVSQFAEELVQVKEQLSASLQIAQQISAASASQQVLESRIASLQEEQLFKEAAYIEQLEQLDQAASALADEWKHHQLTQRQQRETNDLLWQERQDHAATSSKLEATLADC